MRRNDRGLVETHPENSQKVRRIFELFAYQSLSVEEIIERLADEGICFTPSKPKFSVSKVYAILKDRSYLGEIRFHGRWFPGVHEPLIDSQTWNRVQVVLGKRVYRSHSILLGEQLISCAFCGRAITPEYKEKQTKKGTNVYVYYRCARYNEEGHPRIRIPERELEPHVIRFLNGLRVKTPSLKEWLIAAFRDRVGQQQRKSTAQVTEAKRQLSRIAEQQKTLLDLRIASDIFELYASGSHTYKSLGEQLAHEGHAFRKSQPRFDRSSLSYILSNRFYIGELHRNGQVFEGKYRRLIDRATFDACQDVLSGRNRRTGSPDLPLSGSVFQCAYCGQSITGERIRRKLKDGGVREHVYYRCANNSPGPDHPRVRWKADDLEAAVVEDLGKMRLATPEIAAWFRGELRAAVSDLTAYRRRQSTSLAKRKTELATMQDRLLNAYLAGTVEEVVYKAKSNELKAEAAKADETLAQLGDVDPTRAETALALFDWTQNAAEIWRGSNNAVRREILDSVCLNRTLTDLNLDATKRKPFDVFAKGLEIKNSRGNCRIFEPFATLVDQFVRSYPVPPAPYLRDAAQIARRSA